MRKRTVNSSIHSFLEPYLESGNEAAIKAARKEYYKKYKAEWRKRQRQQTKQFTVHFTVEEAKNIAVYAHLHHKSRTAYIKAAALSYEPKQYIVPDKAGIGEIRVLLAKTYSVLSAIVEELGINVNETRNVLEIMANLEQKVLSQLQYPSHISSWLKLKMRDDPAIKVILNDVLKTANGDY